MSNIEVLVFHRPKSMIEQIRDRIEKTDKDWILFLDEDSHLSDRTIRTLCIFPIFDCSKDIVRFRWENNPNGSHGVGLYRVSALRKLNFKVIPSAGLDLTIQGLLSVGNSYIFSFTHPVKSNYKANIRYGKGRAYYLRIVKPKKAKFPRIRPDIRKIPVYIFWIMGFFYGFMTPIRDETW